MKKCLCSSPPSYLYLSSRLILILYGFSKRKSSIPRDRKCIPPKKISLTNTPQHTELYTIFYLQIRFTYRGFRTTASLSNELELLVRLSQRLSDILDSTDGSTDDTFFLRSQSFDGVQFLRKSPAPAVPWAAAVQEATDSVAELDVELLGQLGSEPEESPEEETLEDPERQGEGVVDVGVHWGNRHNLHEESSNGLTEKGEDEGQSDKHWKVLGLTTPGRVTFDETSLFHSVLDGQTWAPQGLAASSAVLTALAAQPWKVVPVLEFFWNWEWILQFWNTSFNRGFGGHLDGRFS